jgi:hypothetical protein
MYMDNTQTHTHIHTHTHTYTHIHTHTHTHTEIRSKYARALTVERTVGRMISSVAALLRRPKLSLRANEVLVLHIILSLLTIILIKQE